MRRLAFLVPLVALGVSSHVAASSASVALFSPLSEPSALREEGGPGARGLGAAVALSGDGNMALVTGTPVGGDGAASIWPFVRSGAKWIQLGAPIDDPGAGDFGLTIALTPDGNTALLHVTNGVYLYKRRGSEWQFEEPLPEFGLGCGFSIAISQSGNTALVGCPEDFGGAGKAIVFQHSDDTWTAEATLYGVFGTGEAQFGRAVALSADGNTAVISAPLESSRTGAVWVFTRSNGTWTEQGEKLTSGEGASTSVFGESLALSADGNQLLIGSYRNNEVEGAAWTFGRSNGRWSEQGGKLSEGKTLGGPAFGFGLALSPDGETAYVSAPSEGEEPEVGAVWVFRRSGTQWQEVQKVSGESAYDGFGSALTLAGDGNTLLVGAPGQDEMSGAAFAYLTTRQSAPTIKKISPSKGPAAGRTVATITGSSFIDPTDVMFGGRAAASFVVNSPTSITAVSPPGTSGAAPVSVTTPWGSSEAGTKARFAYERPTITELLPSRGPTAGETGVTIHGSGFQPNTGTEVSFGKVSSASVSCSSTTECVAITPAIPRPKTVKVIASVGSKKSKGTASTYYTYE